MKIALLLAFSVVFLSCAQKASVAHYSGANETARLNSFLDVAFQEIVAELPEEQSYLGIKGASHKLNDRSEAFAEKMLNMGKKQLQTLQAFDYDQLDSQGKLSYDLFKLEVENRIADYQWRDYGYPVNHMDGIHVSLPSLMMNLHRVESERDVQDYIARLNEFSRVFREVMDGIERSEKLGVIPPRYVIQKILQGSQNIISGRPFDNSKKDSPLLADFKVKIGKVKGIDRDKYTQLAVTALRDSVGPSYEKFNTRLREQEKKSNMQAGVWRFDRGDEYYKNRLARVTTTNYSPDFVHKLGLLNVDRIHGEMREIMARVGFKGDLNAFFKYVKTDPKFYYTQSAAGREKYLKLATGYINNMRKNLDKLFIIKPKADVVVKAVEIFREKTGGTAFYEGPAIDGSRPGAYFVNLSNLKELPTWEAESLAYHEGIPGHHMQISVAQEMKSLPKFRQHGHYTAYIEGWGLYAERVPKEIGMYKDPYSDFGRLSAELYRACRLVVDTGIHTKKWSRDQAIDFMNKNTPNDHEKNVRQIDRYIVWPGQATAYMVGMLKILELRRRAEAALKEKFNIRQFHDVVLQNGAVPLNVLEDLVRVYVEQQGATLTQGQLSNGAMLLESSAG